MHSADLAWQERGQQERLLLEATLGAWLVAPIEHVGSTAVPNLSAKPILDFQAAVTNLDCAADLAAALAPAGWHYAHLRSMPALGDDSSSRSLRGAALHTCT